jgi:hypothetical protein
VQSVFPVRGFGPRTENDSLKRIRTAVVQELVRVATRGAGLKRPAQLKRKRQKCTSVLKESKRARR